MAQNAQANRTGLNGKKVLEAVFFKHLFLDFFYAN